MKLQACSKIITLAALGFTLTAAGAFYSLISAEHTIDANYQQELKERFTAVGADLNHYVQRINGDYYELINSSLSNILALDQSYYRKDPLLNFFEQNIRTGGAYSSGENLVYALEGLNYFGVPYIAYNLDSKELTVHGLKDHNDDESTQHLLKARNQNGQTLEEMISEPQTLAQSFTIFYSGSDTYLCLRLFDQDTNSNYYIVSSYLEVLDNIALNLKKVFSDIDPMLQGILKDDAVMIVRRGQPILKSKDFDLALDMSSSHLRELIGVRLIDQDGNLLDDASSITQEHQASILAVSYVRSINSYLLVKRPFDLIKSDTSLILLAKIFTIVLSLLSVGLIARIALKDNQGERRKLKMLSSLVRKLNDMSPADFKQRLQQAYVDLQPPTKSKALFTILGIAMPIALVGAWYFLGGESEQSRASMLFDQCQANDAEACTQLGLMYQDGEEVKANPYVAQALFTKGCSLKNADACGYLGQIYAKGKAVDIRSLPDLPGQASYSEQDIEQMRLMLLEGENSRNVLKFEPEQKLQ